MSYELSQEGRQEIKEDEKKGEKFPVNGLFHKDGIKETAFDLQQSLWQDMQKMQGMGGENKITKFLNTLKEM